MKNHFVILPVAMATMVSVQAAQPLDVSLIQLIANPKEFHGKRVRVVGYMHLEFEGDGFYIHKEDYEKSLYRNGIWIDLSDKAYKAALAKNDKYVIVVGKFDANNRGHMDLWSGSIDSIERLDTWAAK